VRARGYDILAAACLVLACGKATPFSPHLGAQHQLVEWAEVAWSPDSTRLAVLRRFAELDSAHSDGLRIVALDGRTIWRGGLGYCPAWDKQGGRLAYMSEDGQIMIRDLRTLDVSQKTWRGWNQFPAWSPDGRELAYQRQSPPDSAGIWVVSIDDLAQRFLGPSGGNAGAPAWSPDGRLIAYAAWDGSQQQIFSMDPAGHSVRQITAGSLTYRRGLKWSPTGNEIAFVAPDGIRVVTVLTGEERLLPGTLPGDVDWPQACSWSPEGTWIVYTKTDLWLVRADGCCNHQLIMAGSLLQAGGTSACCKAIVLH
jgi:Tol biopolymer transport system component